MIGKLCVTFLVFSLSHQLLFFPQCQSLELASGIAGMINTAKTLQSMTSSMKLLLSTIMKPVEAAAGRRAEQDRFRHNFFINPVMKPNVTTRKRHIPIVWDMASSSYKVEFMVYSRQNPSIAEVLSVANASHSNSFDKTKETKFIIHDYNQSCHDPLLTQLRNEYLSHSRDMNVIITDWEQARKYSYTVAATVTEYVGVMGARLLVEMEADLSKVHVIGFGLGAHAAGVMGHDLNGKLRRITGLDPSLPLFRMKHDNQKLDPLDAHLVDIIHSDGGDNFWHASHLGMGNVMGHVDVYVNSGIFQPGCPAPSLPSYEDMYCSHIRALDLYVESVVNKENVIGCSCDSWSAFKGMQCDCTNKMIYVGESLPRKAQGRFYLVTRDQKPYGMGRNGAFPIPKFNKFSQ